MPETAMIPQMLALLLFIGAFAGILAGMLGVGGGVVLVAAFFYAFQGLGYESPQLMQICLATSLATIVVTSFRSVMGHNKRGAVDWGILRGWAPGIVIGAGMGVFAAMQLSSTALQGIFGLLAISVGLYMLLGRQEWRLAPQMPTGSKRLALSPLIGFLSVLMGIGGGSIGVPVMTLHNVPIHRAIATAAGFGALIAVPSVVGFLSVDVVEDARPPWTVGAVNLPAFAVISAMTILTTPFGVRMAHAMDPRPLRHVFAVFLILVALNMLWKAYGA